MYKTRRSLLASQLARAFTYAELHCTLLIRHLRHELLKMPQLPPLVSEEATLNAFSAHIDNVSFIELKATLRAVGLVSEQMLSASMLDAKDCMSQLEDIKVRLSRSRRWLVQIAEDDLRQYLDRQSWNDADIGHAVCLPLDRDADGEDLFLQ